MKANNNWNYYNFQFNWNKIEWADQKQLNCKKNTLCV